MFYEICVPSIRIGQLHASLTSHLIGSVLSHIYAAVHVPVAVPKRAPVTPFNSPEYVIQVLVPPN